MFSLDGLQTLSVSLVPLDLWESLVLCFSETGSPTEVLADLQLLILLSQFPECGGYSCELLVTTQNP